MSDHPSAPNAASSELETLARAQLGDPAALKSLFSVHLSTVHRFALRMCRDEERARDVAQESLLTALKSLPDFRGDAAFSTWLFTITRSHCGRIRKKSDRETASEDVHSLLDDTASPDASPDEHAAHEELSDVLDAALARLEPAEREVILLRDVEGIPAKDAAQILGVSVAALKSRLHRARASLRLIVQSLVQSGPVSPVASNSCPDVLAALSNKLEGDLSVADCSVLEAHIATCPSCASLCASAQRLIGACASLRNLPQPAALQDLVEQTISSMTPRSSP